MTVLRYFQFIMGFSLLYIDISYDVNYIVIPCRGRCPGMALLRGKSGHRERISLPFSFLQRKSVSGEWNGESGQREILCRMKVWKRRNTLCISSFQTAQSGQKIRCPPKPVGSALTLYYLSCRQAMPGSSRPSRNSREAPPPVEMWVILSAKPSCSQAAAESPPPTMVTASESARA